MTVCRLCAKPAHEVRIFATEGAEKLGLYRCDGCQTEFLEPQPSDAWLMREYAGYYGKRATSIDRPRAAMFRGLFAQAGIPLENQRILEIGAGEGDCASAILKIAPSAKITAIEANPEAVAHFSDLVASGHCQLIQRSVEDWLSTRPNAAERYDILLMFDVLEHLRDPIATLRALVNACLVPGGILLATFPNGESISHAVLREFWPQYKVEHLFYYSAAGVNELARGAGLKTKSLAPLTKKLPLEYLFAVGGNFGPRALQHGVSWMKRLTPQFLLRRRLSLRYGEWLWSATRAK